MATIEKRSSTFLRKKVHPDDLAGGFSDLEMTWLLYCVGAATECEMSYIHILDSTIHLASRVILAYM